VCLRGLTGPGAGFAGGRAGAQRIVEDSVVLNDVNPDQPIRFPVEDKGRLEALSREGWPDRNLGAAGGFYGLEPSSQGRSS
jgi:hypothetical protein